MGRRSKNTRRPARNHSLLGWGIFVSLLLGIASPQVGMSLIASVALAGTSLVVFAMLWLLSTSGDTPTP